MSITKTSKGYRAGHYCAQTVYSGYEIGPARQQPPGPRHQEDWS